MNFYLVDVSEWQPGADPAAIHAAHFGMIARLGYGAQYQDRIISRVLPAMRSTGALANGFYGFERSVHSPEDQVGMWIRVLGAPRANEYGILDWETDPANGSLPSVAHRNRCLQLMDEQFGRLTVLYSGDALLRQYGVDRPDRPVWDADYGATPGFRPLTFWQFTNGEISSPGGLYPIDFPSVGKCDGSIFYGSEADFARAVGINVAPPAPQDFLEELMAQITPAQAKTFAYNQAADYVRSLYFIWLPKQGIDGGGFNFWVRALASGTHDADGVLDEFQKASTIPPAKLTQLVKAGLVGLAA